MPWTERADDALLDPMLGARAIVILCCAAAASFGCHDGADSPRAPTESPHRDAGEPQQQPRTDEPVARFAKSRPPCVDAPFVEPGGPPRDERWTVRTPATPTKTGAIVCMKQREVWRDDEGRVRACTIAKPVRTHGLDLTGDNYTLFHADGRPHQTYIAGEHTVRAGDGREVRCAADLLVLDPAGHLEGCTLVTRIEIGDTACRKGESLALHASGKLAGCVVDEPVEALGAVFAAGTRLAFHDNGALARASLNEPTYIAGWLVHADIEADDAGRLTFVVFAEKRTLGGIELPADARVWLHADASPRHIEYVAADGFLPHGEQWRDTRHVTFDCAGSIVADRTEHYQSPSPEPR